MRRLILGSAMAGILAMACWVRGEDWPGWLGPRGDGISREVLPAGWPEDGPKKLWEVKVGIGYSSPIVVKGVAYLFMTEEGEERLAALKMADGSEAWKKGYAPLATKERGYKGARATPLFEAGRIYTIGEAGDVACWDAADGKILWHVNVLTECKAENLDWGIASNPLIVGDRVFVQVGRGGPIAVGIDKKSGKIDWKSEATGLSGYAHPILVEVAGTKEIVVFGGKAVYGFALESGKTLWQEKWETELDINATTPIYRDGNLMVSSDAGSMMLKLTGGATPGAEKVWAEKEMASKFPQTILDGDFVYGNSGGRLKCLHWPDGKLAWKEDLKLNVGGSLLRAGDKILAMSDRGKLILVKADGTTHEKLAEAKLFDAVEVWATPVVSEGKMVARGGGVVACYDLAAAP